MQQHRLGNRCLPFARPFQLQTVLPNRLPKSVQFEQPLRCVQAASARGLVAADRAVRDVYVDGEQVVADGKVLNIDLQAASEALEAAQQRSMAQVPDRDWAGRSAEELAPMVLPTAESLTQA